MKVFNIKISETEKRTEVAINDVLVDGGFVDDMKISDGYIHYKISCNSDTEFADLFLEVGKQMERFKNV